MFGTKKEIDYTIIVGSDTQKSASSSIIRGAIGGAVLGPVGLVGGALAGKNKTEVDFKVVFKDGTSGIYSAKRNSQRYYEYMSYLKEF